MKKILLNTLICLIFICSTTFAYAKNVPFSIEILPAPQCSDRVDNDIDGFVDFPDDDDCTSETDPFEGIPPVTSIVFSGISSPFGIVTLLKDGEIVSSVSASDQAEFSITISGLTGGTYSFSLYNNDRLNNLSEKYSFTVNVIAGSTTNISGIFLAPSISADKVEFTKAEVIYIIGESSPNTSIILSLLPFGTSFNTATDSDGKYSFNLQTELLESREYQAVVYAQKNGLLSPLSKLIDFKIVEITPTIITPKCQQADLNCDGKVNIIDFSIGKFWYQKTLTPGVDEIEAERLNNDNTINLIDFSIMAAYWTG